MTQPNPAPQPVNLQDAAEALFEEPTAANLLAMLRRPPKLLINKTIFALILINFALAAASALRSGNKNSLIWAGVGATILIVQLLTAFTAAYRERERITFLLLEQLFAQTNRQRRELGRLTKFTLEDTHD